MPRTKRVVSKTVQQLTHEVNGVLLPVKYYKELGRGSMRISFGKKAILYRVPLELARIPEKEEEMWEWFRESIAKQILKDPSLLHKYQIKSYTHGEEYCVGQRKYLLHISEKGSRKSLRGQIVGDIIYIELPTGLDFESRNVTIKKLLSRVIAKDFYPHIRRRVNELNAQFFQIPNIKSVNLKYNTSNWGSCSTSGNINLSTRLFFAPAAVIDYVIIHELAHFFEQNHSSRFWAHVEDAMPDYKVYEDWLTEHGSECDF